MDCSMSSVDADVSVAFSGSNPQSQNSCEELQRITSNSISSSAGFSSYFKNHFIGNALSTPVERGKEALDIKESPIKQENNMKLEDSGICLNQEGLSPFIGEEPDDNSDPETNMASLFADRDQALIDFFLHRKTSGGSFDVSSIKSELSDDLVKGEGDEILHDETSRKYQEMLEKYIVSEAEGIRVFRCMICDFLSPMTSTIKKHMYTHIDNKKPFRCNACGETFRKLAQLKKHKEVHDEQKQFHCSDCPSTYSDERALKHHIMRKHTGDRPFKCNLCKALYVRRADLKKHLEITHREDRPFLCPYCDYRSKDAQTLKFHLTSHSEARPYVCDLCPKSYKRLGDLKVHIENTHEAKPIHKCKEEGCDFATSKVLELRRHALIHSGIKLFPCPECQANFTSQILLRQHQRRHSGERVHNCTLCDYGCLKLFSLKRHVRTHLVNSGNQCPICQQNEFLNEPELIKHVLSHSDSLPYRCALCTASFLTPRALHCHKEVHKEERPFICSLCDFAFKKEQDLKRHILGHTQERPFKCEECGKGFMQQNQLNLHLIVHSDHKPYSCTICHYACKRAADLRVHTLSHSKDRTISCNMCSYKCKRQRDLNRHMHSHTTEKPFECPVCGVRLRRAYNLRQHMLRHGEQDRGEVSCRICLQPISNTMGLPAHMKEAHPGEDLGSGDGSDSYGDYKSSCGSRLDSRLTGKKRKGTAKALNTDEEEGGEFAPTRLKVKTMRVSARTKAKIAVDKSDSKSDKCDINKDENKVCKSICMEDDEAAEIEDNCDILKTENIYMYYGKEAKVEFIRGWDLGYRDSLGNHEELKINDEKICKAEWRKACTGTDEENDEDTDMGENEMESKWADDTKKKEKLEEDSDSHGGFFIKCEKSELVNDNNKRSERANGVQAALKVLQKRRSRKGNPRKIEIIQDEVSVAENKTGDVEHREID